MQNSNTRLTITQLMLEDRIHTLAAGPLPNLRRCAYVWEETGPGRVSLILFARDRSYPLAFTVTELLAGVGGEEEEARQLIEKLEGFLRDALGKGAP